MACGGRWAQSTKARAWPRGPPAPCGLTLTGLVPAAAFVFFVLPPSSETREVGSHPAGLCGGQGLAVAMGTDRPLGWTAFQVENVLPGAPPPTQWPDGPGSGPNMGWCPTGF